MRKYQPISNYKYPLRFGFVLWMQLGIYYMKRPAKLERWWVKLDILNKTGSVICQKLY
jgi:hypothetical protein